MNNLSLSTIIFLLLQANTLWAQKIKTYETQEIHSAITIDGNIDESVWNKVKWAGQFTQTFIWPITNLG